MYAIPEKLKSRKLAPAERARIIESIRSYRSIDDVVTYLFAKMKETEITADDEILHSAFFELQKKHLKLLDELIFSCGDVFPYSNELQRSIFNLQSSGLMETPNPVYEYYKISKEAKEILSKNLSKVFSETERSELDNMSDELSKLLKRRLKRACRPISLLK
jgi:hypothetical protein